MTIVSLLKVDNKTIDQIQNILKLKKAKNLNKQAIKAIRDLTMEFRNRDIKRKTNTNNQCYNCNELSHFGQNYPFPDKKLYKIQYYYRDKRSQSRLQMRNKQNNRLWATIQKIFSMS